MKKLNLTGRRYWTLIRTISKLVKASPAADVGRADRCNLCYEQNIAV